MRILFTDVRQRLCDGSIRLNYMVVTGSKGSQLSGRTVNTDGRGLCAFVSPELLAGCLPLSRVTLVPANHTSSKFPRALSGDSHSPVKWARMCSI